MKLFKIVATALLLTGIIGFTAVSKQSADPGGGVQPNAEKSNTTL